MLRRVVWWKLTDVSEMLTASIVTWTIIAETMEAVSTSETSVNFYQTTRRSIIPEDIHLHVRRTESRSKVVNAVASFLGGPRFKFLPGDRIS
jgi:hypothetical protein